MTNIGEEKNRFYPLCRFARHDLYVTTDGCQLGGDPVGDYDVKYVERLIEYFRTKCDWKFEYGTGSWASMYGFARRWNGRDLEEMWGIYKAAGGLPVFSSQLHIPLEIYKLARD